MPSIRFRICSSHSFCRPRRCVDEVLLPFTLCHFASKYTKETMRTINISLHWCRCVNSHSTAQTNEKCRLIICTSYTLRHTTTHSQRFTAQRFQVWARVWVDVGRCSRQRLSRWRKQIHVPFIHGWYLLGSVWWWLSHHRSEHGSLIELGWGNSNFVGHGDTFTNQVCGGEAICSEIPFVCPVVTSSSVWICMMYELYANSMQTAKRIRLFPVVSHPMAGEIIINSSRRICVLKLVGLIFVCQLPLVLENSPPHTHTKQNTGNLKRSSPCR